MSDRTESYSSKTKAPSDTADAQGASSPAGGSREDGPKYPRAIQGAGNRGDWYVFWTDSSADWSHMPDERTARLCAAAGEWESLLLAYQARHNVACMFELKDPDAKCLCPLCKRTDETMSALSHARPNQ